MQKRFYELDSLRGLAALSVLFSHCLITVQSFAINTRGINYPRANALKYTPLHIFWAGGEAVIFFFILSGFVLSLPFGAGKYKGYFPFVIKRIFRIYTPYIPAIFVSVGLMYLFNNGPIHGLSDWFNGMWPDSVSGHLILRHIVLIDNFQNWVYNPVFWSLVQEMRVSIIFPLLMILIVRFGWKVNLIACAASTAWWFYMFNHHSSMNEYNYMLTFRYIPMFIIGALVAKYREPLILKFEGVRRGYKGAILIVGILLYTYNWIAPAYPHYYMEIVGDYAVTAGAVIFMISALSFKSFSSILTFKPVHFVGKISYSLYLYHAVILFSLIHALYNRIPLELIWLLTLLLSIVVAYFSYRFTEIPAMRLGAALSKKFISRAKHEETLTSV